jgi:hypothetical protein
VQLLKFPLGFLSMCYLYPSIRLITKLSKYIDTMRSDWNIGIDLSTDFEDEGVHAMGN